MMKKIWINLDAYRIVEEDLLFLINSGTIKTKTNIKRVGFLLKFLPWLKERANGERYLHSLTEKKRLLG